MKSKPLLDIQMRIWRFIAAYQQREGWAPTYREIADGVGLSGQSTASVSAHLDTLQDARILKHRRGAARAIHLLKPPPKQADEEKKP